MAHITTIFAAETGSSESILPNMAWIKSINSFIKGFLALFRLCRPCGRFFRDKPGRSEAAFSLPAGRSPNTSDANGPVADAFEGC